MEKHSLSNIIHCPPGSTQEMEGTMGSCTQAVFFCLLRCSQRVLPQAMLLWLVLRNVSWLHPGNGVRPRKIVRSVQGCVEVHGFLNMLLRSSQCILIYLYNVFLHL